MPHGIELIGFYCLSIKIPYVAIRHFLSYVEMQCWFEIIMFAEPLHFFIFLDLGRLSWLKLWLSRPRMGSIRWVEIIKKMFWSSRLFRWCSNIKFFTIGSKSFKRYVMLITANMRRLHWKSGTRFSIVVSPSEDERTIAISKIGVEPDNLHSFYTKTQLFVTS